MPLKAQSVTEFNKLTCKEAEKNNSESIYMDMDMATLLLCLFAFLVLHIITKHLLNKIQNLPPSPFLSLPVIGHMYLLRRPIHKTLSKISQRYGPILLLRFGCRRVLVVSSPEIAGECFSKNDIIFANRPHLIFVKYFSFNGTNFVWAPYGDHWRNLRRIASLEILSTHRVQMLSFIRMEEVRSLICHLFKNQNQIVNIRTAFFELTLNIMMRMIAGKRYYGKSMAEVEEAKRFREIHADTTRLSRESVIGDFLPWFRSQEIEKQLMECQRKRDGLMQGLIDEQKREMENELSGEKKKNLIQVLLTLQETDPDYYHDDLIKGLMLVLLLAGTDTTINTMEWALSLLVNHPRVLKKAQTEIDECVGNNRLVEETDVAQIPYLQCIISEAMRMYPTLPLLLPHESSEDCTLAGFRIPRGTMLFVNAWAIQNDPNIWVDPAEFRPERFEGMEGAKDGFRFMPFGYGRRSCPGEGLAQKVVGLALASLIQCFEWKRTGENFVDMGESPGFTVPKLEPLQVVCRPRQNMLDILSRI